MSAPTDPAQRHNAFTELMSAKASMPARRGSPLDKTRNGADPARQTTVFGRDGLAAYTANPTAFPSSRVIYHTDKFVVINDLFPKSSLHILLLPRDTSKQLLHPFVAFEDAAFLAEVQQEVRSLRSLAAKELKRRHGKSSKQQPSSHATHGEAGVDENVAPSPGRDWEKDIISGIHAHPSMNHLHIHVLSVDRHSECMRHRKHYNSFATPFLVDVEDFPLAPDDRRRHPGQQGYLDSDLVCWRCGANFGNRFAKLKAHLDEEFVAWQATRSLREV